MALISCTYPIPTRVGPWDWAEKTAFPLVPEATHFPPLITKPGRPSGDTLGHLAGAGEPGGLRVRRARGGDQCGRGYRARAGERPIRGGAG